MHEVSVANDQFVGDGIGGDTSAASRSWQISSVTEVAVAFMVMPPEAKEVAAVSLAAAGLAVEGPACIRQAGGGPGRSAIEASAGAAAGGLTSGRMGP
jgi:hypothetical protein